MPASELTSEINTQIATSEARANKLDGHVMKPSTKGVERSEPYQRETPSMPSRISFFESGAKPEFCTDLENLGYKSTLGRARIEH